MRSVTAWAAQHPAWAVLVAAVALVVAIDVGTWTLMFTLRHSNALGRRCVPDYAETLGPQRIAVVSLADESPRMGAGHVFELSKRTTDSYCRRHNYTFTDASALLDPTRPPNWAKVRALQSLLQEGYDYVLWLDADTVVMNHEFRLEQLVQPEQPGGAPPDLVMTADYSGVNTGVMMFRNSEWSRLFLQLWWDQVDFVVDPTVFSGGQVTKSGDNDAMKFLMANMDPAEMRRHVRFPMQCAMNSYEYTFFWHFGPLYSGTYSVGDFVIHFAGDKRKEMKMRRFLQGEIYHGLWY